LHNIKEINKKKHLAVGLWRCSDTDKYFYHKYGIKLSAFI